MAAKFPYYLFADSPEGRKKETEILGTLAPDTGSPCQHDIRRGFVCKRVPHVTPKSIVNNPDIHKGMTSVGQLTKVVFDPNVLSWNDSNFGGVTVVVDSINAQGQVASAQPV